MFLHIQNYDQYTDFRQNGIDWANQVLTQHADRKVILATHDIWATDHIRNNLLQGHDNIVLTNAGHHCVRETYFVERGPNGGVSNNFVTDYQCDQQEIMLLRYYVFKPLEDRVDYYTYSPITGEFESDENSEGSFPLVQADP